MKNTKTRTFIQKLTMVAFLFAMVLLLMPMNTFAAKKPGQVKNIEEVKATDKSVTIKFKKVSGAKKYQVQVYETIRQPQTKKNADGSRTYSKKWKTKKKIFTKLDTKKTKCTIKGLNKSSSYAVKIRAYNGKSYGKWATQYVWTTDQGRRYPGRTTATGDNLKKQYENWKADWISSAKKSADETYCFAWTILWKYNHSTVARDLKCTKSTDKLVDNPNEYTMEEVYATYKRGYGTDLEIYHLVMDVLKTAGLRCEIRYNKHLYDSYLEYDGVGLVKYAVLGYSGIYNEEMKLDEAFALQITPKHESVGDGIYYQIDCSYSDYINSLE